METAACSPLLDQTRMHKLLWLLASAIPLWLAAKVGAPKWGLLLAAAPFFLIAMSMDDPDEDALGEASGPFRKGALAVLGIGGLILGTVLLVLWHVLFPRP